MLFIQGGVCYAVRQSYSRIQEQRGEYDALVVG